MAAMVLIESSQLVFCHRSRLTVRVAMWSSTLMASKQTVLSKNEIGSGVLRNGSSRRDQA